MGNEGIRQRLILVLCVMLILVWAFPSRADDTSSPTVYTLSECIQQTLEANPQLEQAHLDVTQAEWKLKSAKLARTPSIELFNLMGVVEDAKGDAITGDTIDDHYGFFNRLKLEFALPIYTFGRLSKGIDAATENVRVQEAAQIKTRDELILRVHELYYGLILARQLLDSTEEIQENFTEAYEIVEERLEKGEATVSEADLLKLRVGLTGVTQGLRKLERETILTEEALRNIMGLDESAQFDLAEERLKPVDFELKSLEEYIRQAEYNNAEMKQLRAGLEAEKARYLSEKSKFYPSLLIVGGLRYAEAPGREDQDNPFLNDDFNYLGAGAAFAVKWDFNFFQTNAEVQEKKVDYLKMKSRFEQGTRGIPLKVKEKYYRVKEKQDNLETSFEARKAGRGLLVLSMTNFKFGIGSGQDVFNALGVYARTAGSYYEAVYEYNMAVAELESTVGTGFQTLEAAENAMDNKKE